MSRYDNNEADLDLSFTIRLETNATEERLNALILSQVQGTRVERGYIVVGNNVIKVDINLARDVKRAAAGDELCYKFEITVFPSGQTTIDVQQGLAERLESILAFEDAKLALDAEWVE